MKFGTKLVFHKNFWCNCTGNFVGKERMWVNVNTEDEGLYTAGNWSCICSAQSGNLCNLEIAHWVYAILRLCGTSAQSRDRAISVACIIEPFKFPSYIKVRDVRNKLLQLRSHLQCRACILKPLHLGLLGSSPIRRNSLPLGLGTGAESNPRPVECPRSRHHHL